MNSRTYTRCHDADCTARTRCQRWLTRHDRAPGIRHAGTLRPLWQIGSQLCSRGIRRRWADDDLAAAGPAGWLILAWLRGTTPALAALSLLTQRPGCYTRTPQPHPWDPRITDAACGYDHRFTDPLCVGCHRARAECPLDQLATLDPRHDQDGLRK